MVILWWNRGELWFAGGGVLGAKNFPFFLDLFFGFFVFGNDRASCRRMSIATANP
jgi:hypothetical protein